MVAEEKRTQESNTLVSCDQAVAQDNANTDCTIAKPFSNPKQPVLSIVIPTKNEAGNVQDLENRKEAIDLTSLRPRGFKTLLEILIRFPHLRTAEIPFHLDSRNTGKSKASVRESLRYILLLWHLRYGEDALRFTRFLIVGASGLVVNSLILALGTAVLGMHYLLSAVIATEGTTVWNFCLAEFWVFVNGQPRRGRFQRFIKFFVMNNSALTLRGPLMYTLTSGLGVHYLLSNLVSLVALTLVRYALADTWIWSKHRNKEDISR